MSLYQITKDKLTEIKEYKFDYEKNLQKLTEQNLECIFGLEYVTSEFPLQKLRIDTLGFDLESKSFVIIEYKKDQSFSVIDQGFAYLGILLNNKADFILEYNEKKKTTLKRTDIDWNETRVYFLANRFNAYQRQAINFRDLPIKLWEVRRYQGDTISYEEITSPDAAESIKTVSRNPVIQNVSRAIKPYSVEDVIKPDWESSRVLFEDLKTKILEIDSQLVADPKKHYIGFKKGGAMIGGVQCYKSKLVLFLCRTRPQDVNDPSHALVYRKNCMKFYNQHISDHNIISSTDINYAVDLFQQVYDKFVKGNDK